MTVVFDDQGNAVVTMTTGELISVRYALDEGAHELAGRAAYFRQVRSKEATSATATAKQAKAASDALEKAVQATLHPKKPKKEAKP